MLVITYKVVTMLLTHTYPSQTESETQEKVFRNEMNQMVRLSMVLLQAQNSDLYWPGGKQHLEAAGETVLFSMPQGRLLIKQSCSLSSSLPGLTTFRSRLAEDCQ